MDKKKEFTLAIKKNVVPEIKSLGYIGSFPHFRKIEGNSMYFVGFQFGRSSLIGNLVVELGFASRENLPDWAKLLPDEKLDYGFSQKRHRLGSKSEKEDGIWFDYESLETEEEIKNLSLTILQLFKKEYPGFIKTTVQ